MLVDLVFGFPFAYILVRRVRYRDLVRALMVFPMFGALYVAFGMSFILLPGGPLDPLLNLLGISSTALLFSLPAVVFAMAIFTFPFMVMSIGTALSNVDPTLEEAAACLGARPWQTFWRVVLPLTRAGVVAGSLMVFGWSIGAFAEPLLLGSLNEQRSLALDALPARRRRERLRPVRDDGRRAAGPRLRRDLLLAALLAWSTRRMTTATAPRRPLLTARRLTAIASHGYIWLCLIVFVLPFLALLSSIPRASGPDVGRANYADAILDSFGDNLLWSFKITGLPCCIEPRGLPAGGLCPGALPGPGQARDLLAAAAAALRAGRRHRPVAAPDLHLHVPPDHRCGDSCSPWPSASFP